MSALVDAFAESTVEQAALSWLDLGSIVAHGPSLAPGDLFAERESFEQVIQARRFRDAVLPKLMSGETRLKQAEQISPTNAGATS